MLVVRPVRDKILAVKLLDWEIWRVAGERHVQEIGTWIC